MTALSIRHGFAGAALAACLGFPAATCTRNPTSATTGANGRATANATTRASKAKAWPTTLLDADAYHDATDCRTLFGAGSHRAARERPDSESAARPTRERRRYADSGEYSDVYTFAGTPASAPSSTCAPATSIPICSCARRAASSSTTTISKATRAARCCRSISTESGEYRVTVTSYRKGETGGYTLSMDVGSNAGLTARLERNGRLESGDDTLTTRRVRRQLRVRRHAGAACRDRPALVGLRHLSDPQGPRRRANRERRRGRRRRRPQQHRSRPDRSRHVSGARDELRVRRERRLFVDDRPVGCPEPRLAHHARRHDADRRRPVDGELDGDDATFEAGEYHDTYVFDGDEGETVRIELSSADFDTYLGLVTPSGEEIANDDFEGDTDRSVIELTLPEAGRYRVQATSYAAGRDRPLPARADDEHGRRARRAALARPRLRPVRRHQRLPAAEHRLEYTAEDATRIRDALIGGGGMQRRRRLHARRQRCDGRQRHLGHPRHRAAAWAPTTRSSCSIRGTAAKCRAATARRPAIPTPWTKRWRFTTAPCSTTSCALCSTRSTRERCCSGSTRASAAASRKTSSPRRAAWASSRPRKTSPRTSRASSAPADTSRSSSTRRSRKASPTTTQDNSITAIELSQYLHERYRADVKSTRSADVVRNEMTLGYQHLVVDRGSIGAYDVLFER